MFDGGDEKSQESKIGKGWSVYVVWEPVDVSSRTGRGAFWDSEEPLRKDMAGIPQASGMLVKPFRQIVQSVRWQGMEC